MRGTETLVIDGFFFTFFVAQLSSNELSPLKQYSSYLRLTTINKYSILAPYSSIWSGFLAARDLLLTVRIKFSRCLTPCSSPLRRFRLIRFPPPLSLFFQFIHSSSCRLYFRWPRVLNLPAEAFALPLPRVKSITGGTWGCFTAVLLLVDEPNVIFTVLHYMNILKLSHLGYRQLWERF